ncbi:hypothetical protein [Curtobacterium sp. MCLR17_044]|uniref:hypothetical protein n=1 Tax=Curtobacterium sp. MCLR17_044 TaxID=2175628 RepID=UPI0011B53626|nr:hypothetical protein [Curtobacterium sp. MCLR17_044]
MARELGVTPQRVHQLQTSGSLAEPEQSDDVVAWPNAYAESFVGRRQGRTVSQSVYGLTPSPIPVELVDDVVLQLQQEERFPVHAMRFDHPEAAVVFLQPLAFHETPDFAGVTQGGSARSVFSDRDALRLVAKRAAEYWFEGDITRAAFVLVGEKYGCSEFFDLVATYDDSDADRRRPAPHWLDVRSPTEPLPKVETSGISARVLRERLGRPVPIFLPDQFTTEVLEQWQANGRQRVALVRDYNGYARAAAAAAIVHALPDLQPDTRVALAGGLLERVRWEESGAAPSGEPHAVVGLADWNDDVDAVEQQLLLRNPDFAARAGAIRELPQTDPLAPSAFTAVADRVQDVIFNTYGDHGTSPSPRVEIALDAALGALYHRTWMAANKRDSDWVDEASSLRPKGMVPYTFRSWSSHSGYAHPISAEHAQALAGDLVHDDAAFRAIRAQLLEAARHYVDKEQLPRLKPMLSRDVGGVRVGYLDVTSEILYCAAIPVLRTPSDLQDPARSFTSIVVEPMTQEGPVYLDTPLGPTLMPFASSHPGPFTHGYSGSGPRNLRTAIEGFLEHVAGAPLSEESEELIGAAVHAADQAGPLVLPRDLILKG